jgi:hypothetical protein
MRGLVTFILVAGIGGGLFLWQKQHEQKPVPPDTQAPSQQYSATSRPALTPAPRGQASEYNWMKRSLDRAADVRDQARAQTKEAQDP